MSSSSPVPAEGKRLHWEQLPAHVRLALEQRLDAPVVEAETQKTGFSPGLAARLRLGDGSRVFLKAVSQAANPDSPAMHRREAEVVAALPPAAPVPRLRWVYDQGGWVALCFDDVAGRHPHEPWTEADLGLVVEALRRMSRDLTPSPIATPHTASHAFQAGINGWQVLLRRGEDRLDAWCARHLSRLAELEARAPEASRGETLLHFDTRADNILIDGEHVYVVDWPSARIGADWVDWAAMAPSVAMQGGPDPEALLRMFQVAAPVDDVDSVVCSLAGYFTVRALDPPPPGIPTVRAFQAAQGKVAVEWLRARTRWA